jgi:WD40 repeat protein
MKQGTPMPVGRRTGILGCILAMAWSSVQAHEPLDTPAWLQAGQGGGVTAIAVSPDGAWIASGSEDATVKLWRASDGTLARTLADGAFQTTALAFSPTGSVLAAGCYDGSIKLWNPTNGTLTRTMSVVWTNTEIGRAYTNLSGKVCSLVFSADGQRLVAGSADWFTRVWQECGRSRTAHS